MHDMTAAVNSVQATAAPLPDFEAISRRACAIGLTMPKLARMAGLDPSVPWRIAQGSDPKRSTLTALHDALVRRERELLTALQAHPEHAA